MVIIRFADPQMERRALAHLVGRFSFKTWATGDTMIPEHALAHLAAAGFEFTVKGLPSYAREYAPVRDTSPAAV